MSKNISNLSGRIGLKDNLFKKMSENVLNDSPKDIKDIAKEYNLGVSTIHGAESFYEFLRPSHREKKAFVCNGSACMCAGTQEKLKETLKSKLGNDKVGEMFCLGHCYENHAFHYDGENYAGKDIENIDQILNGEVIKQEKFTHPYFNNENVNLQKDLHLLQGKKRTWFCGSYFGYGFHEDGLKSSIDLVKKFNT